MYSCTVSCTVLHGGTQASLTNARIDNLISDISKSKMVGQSSKKDKLIPGLFMEGVPEEEKHMVDNGVWAPGSEQKELLEHDMVS